MIEIKNLTKEYLRAGERVTALDHIDFSVEDGEFVAITGPSGSGKTTLMQIIGCLDSPTEGDYFLDRVSVSELSSDRLAQIRNEKIGFIFQGFNLIGELSALENVELPLVYRGIPKKERRETARKALSEVGLLERMEHRPSQMSGGQQQRVAVARALAARPPLILADEPTGNLDSRVGETVMEMLLALNRAGHTVVLITHDEKVASFASRRVTLSDGKIS